MPYIKEKIRQYLGKNYPLPIPVDPGELNYLFTKIALAYVGKYPNYRVYNDIIGALECCKLELYRRKVVDYEEKKIELNGDIY